nr:hypothetical protein BaRGS_002397 [Batillaria attramentaria]
MAVIKTLSCFYNITNTGRERPHKSMLMSIPVETKTDNVVTLFLKQPGLEDQDESPSQGSLHLPLLSIVKLRPQGFLFIVSSGLTESGSNTGMLL